MTLIPPGERRELRSVVRSQFKVLRTEVKQRKPSLSLTPSGSSWSATAMTTRSRKTLTGASAKSSSRATEDLSHHFGLQDDQEGGRWSRIYAL